MQTDGLNLEESDVEWLRGVLDRSGHGWIEGARRASGDLGVRRWKRVPLSVPVSIRLADGRELSGTTVDCSTGGIGLVTTCAIDVNARLQLHLDLADEPLTAYALVRRIQSTADGHLLGCEFEDVQPRLREALAELVTSQERRQAMRAEIEVPVSYRVLGAEAYVSTVSTDVSEAGVRIEVGQPVVPGEALALGDRVELSMIVWNSWFRRRGTIIRLDISRDASWAVACFDPIKTGDGDFLGNAIQKACAEETEELYERALERMRSRRSMLRW